MYANFKSHFPHKAWILRGMMRGASFSPLKAGDLHWFFPGENGETVPHDLIIQRRNEKKLDQLRQLPRGGGAVAKIFIFWEGRKESPLLERQYFFGSSFCCRECKYLYMYICLLFRWDVFMSLMSMQQEATIWSLKENRIHWYIYMLHVII